MELLKRYQTIVVLVVALAIPIYLLVSSHRDRNSGAMAQKVSASALGFFQNHNDYVVGNSADIWDSYIDLVHTKAENEALRLENARLREENIGLQGILQQNARLSKLSGFKQDRPLYELEPARVIAADISPFFRVLRIRIETQSDAIKPEMPVVSAEGLVGRIERVAGRYCDVMLAIDPRSKVDVLTQLNRSRGILTGTGNEQNYDAKISYLLRRDEVEEGELIVTSGRDGKFPKELPVGRIKSIDARDFGLYQSVTVTPIVDFSRIEEVYIITGVKE